MSDRPAPVGLAMVICDQIIEDKLTSKKSLIGIFNNIGSSVFPCRHPQLGVFVSITEGKGSYEARLQITNENTTDVIANVKGQIKVPDISVVAEINFSLVGIVFPKPGLYSIEFYCDDILVLERRFNVTEIQKKPPPQGPPAAEL